jgi:cold shock CspA family protein
LVEAFDVLGLQLKEIVRKKQDHKNGKSVKHQGTLLNGNAPGTIKKVFADYGFIVTSDNQEVFFHRNVLKDVSMETLGAGDTVTFAMEEGDKGPQAVWVKAG